MKIYLITRNPSKILAAKSVFDKYNIKIQGVKKDYPEIQADTSLEIARYTAIQAAKDLKEPAIREDHSLFIEALGVPGPYTNYIEKKIPAEKLSFLIKQLHNNRGYFEIATVLAYPNNKTFEYTFQIPITFGKKPKGKNPRGWDGLIRLYDNTKAITEYPEKKDLIYGIKAIKQ